MSVSYAGLPTTKRRRDRAQRVERFLTVRALGWAFFATIGLIAFWSLIVGEADLVTWASMLVCLLAGAACMALAHRELSKRAFIPFVLLGVSVQVVLSLHFDQPAAGFFLLVPAIYIALVYWDDKPVFLGGLGLTTAAFIAEPLIIGGDHAVARVAMTAPIFVAVTCIIGYLGREAAQMNHNSGRSSSTISSLLVALQERDGYTADHSAETVDLALAVGEKLRISEQQRTTLADVALLHDIGKIGIPNEILNKAGGLDAYEWQFMKRHPEIGERIVAPVPGFADVAKAIRHEHERWDGAGYPDGLKAVDIPLPSRIVLVCDAFHAMMTDRPYRAAIGLERAREELIVNAGSQFDPAVVQALLAVLEEEGASENLVRMAPAADDAATQSDDQLRAVAG